MAGFNKEIISGVLWSSIQVFVNQAFSFIIKLILAKLLFPEDFGLIGMAVVFTSLLSVFNELGMGAALIQKKKELLTPEHFHTSFWTGVAWSVTIFLIVVFIVAPLAADFYDSPALQEIIPFLSLGILASPVNLVHIAQLTRSLNFKKLALINNASSVFSGTLSVILALLGAGVWSLVFNSVASFVVAMPLFFKATGWTPKFIWSKTAFKDVFGFGVYTTGTNLFNQLISQFDFLLVGKLVGASSLGIYSFAFMLTDIVKQQIASVLNKVMFPVYSRMEGNKDEMKSFYLKVIKFNSLIIYPTMSLQIVFAEFIISFVFGEKWLPSVILVRILSFSVIVHTLINSSNSLIRAYGKPNLELKLQFIKAIFFFVPLISFGTVYYGTIGTAVGFTVAQFFSVILAFFYLKKILHLRFAEIINSVRSAFLVSGLAGFTAYLTQQWFFNWYISILIFFIALVLLFLILAKQEIEQLINLGKSFVKKKKV